MARELILNLKKKKSTFGISKIDRKKLYGFKKRLFLDEKGKACSKVYCLSLFHTIFIGGFFMLEVLVLATVFCAYAVRTEIQIKNLRRDILLVAKNPRPARTELKKRKHYSALD